MEAKKIVKYLMDLFLDNDDYNCMIKDVKAQKISGVIYVPKKYVGKKCFLVLSEGDDFDED